MFITAAPSLGVKTLPELIALAKTRGPASCAYGTNGPGRLTHLTGELLQSRAGIKLLDDSLFRRHRAGAQRRDGRPHPTRFRSLFRACGRACRPVPSGQSRSLRPSASRIPGLADGGGDAAGFAAGGWQVLVAPVGTPDAIIQKINADLNKAMSDPETRKQLAQFNRDERLLSSAETLAFIEHEQATWGPILKQIGQQIGR